MNALDRIKQEVNSIKVDMFIPSKDVVEAEYMFRIESMESHVKREITMKDTGEVKQLDQWKLGIHFVEIEDEIPVHFHRILYLAHTKSRDNGDKLNPGLLSIQTDFEASNGNFLKTFMLLPNTANKGLKLYVLKEVPNGEDDDIPWEE